MEGDVVIAVRCSRCSTSQIYLRASNASIIRRWLKMLPAVLSIVAVAACASSASLHASATGGLQPIVTAQGVVVSESSTDKIIERVAKPDTPLEQAQLDKLVTAVRGSLSSPLITGNRAQVLVDGPQTFIAIDKAIAQAQHHIHVETYIFADDGLGRKFADLLIAKRKAGVQVRVIYDAVGSIKTTGDFFAEMKEAGIEVIEFQPLNPVKTWFWQFHNRDHRKIIIVDGRVAFTGGMNISDAYSSSSTSKPGPEAGLKEGWRDTHVQIEGPAVRQLQSLFLDTWMQLGGKVDNAPEKYYPEIPAQGSYLVSAIGSSGLKEKDESIYQTYMAAIRNCSKRIWLTQAYLMPPQELSDALIAAVKRGIDVRIVVPGFTDSKVVLNAAHSEYDKLLAGGVRLYEAQSALLHAKTALIDDSVVLVGSANLDYRSFLHNNEVTAVMIGDEAGKRMREIFLRDIGQGRELTLQKWRDRSYWQRTKETLSSLLKFWL